jgi:hypothetical protein
MSRNERRSKDLYNVAGACFTLGTDHSRALGDPPKSLAKGSSAAHERDLEIVLIDVIL